MTIDEHANVALTHNPQSAMNSEPGGDHLRNPNLDTFIALVSVLSVLNSVLYFLPITDVVLVDIILLFGLVIDLIFIANYLYRLITAESKPRYAKSRDGIIDLLACIPFIQVSWLFRGLKSYLVFWGPGHERFRRDLSRGRAEAAVPIVLFIIVLIIEFGAYAVILAERGDPAATITTAQTSIWWVFETITTVGYGDYTPVTLAGRVVGVVVMAAGIGTYALLAGFIAKTLIGQKEETGDDSVGQSVIDFQELNRHMTELENSNRELVKNDRELRNQLERIERLLSSRSDGESKN